MNQEYPTLNDVAPSWADIQTSFSIYGGSLIELIDYSAINWSDTVEVGAQRGASGGRVMKRTTGQLSSEASATFYKSGLRKLLKGLAAKAPTRGNQKLVSLVGFDIHIQHSPPESTDIFEVKIKGCRLLGRTAAMAEGADADQVEVNLNPIQIVEIIDGEEIVLL